MASSSSSPKQRLGQMNPNIYPEPLASYEDVIGSQKLFMATLEKLHSVMGTKFMIPIIGGRELDLHKLFVEVTSRGGIEKIIRERKWKEVTATFSFPPTATNASFVLRKYYHSLLHHYEQIYYFKARGQIPPDQSGLSVPAQVTNRPSPQIQAIAFDQLHSDSTDSPRAVCAAGTRVVGVIDGKFESGYLVTVVVGSETLKGVLFQTPQAQTATFPNLTPNCIATPNILKFGVPGTKRRRRRKKSEIKRRDPAHPKPNRSGYNFFFKEQHARLKPLHPGKDREISRMIGDLWNNLNEQEKSVYQEKALEDKERYRLEMQDYKEKLRTGQLIGQAVMIPQRPTQEDIETQDADAIMQEAEEDGDNSIESSNESDPEDDRNCISDPEMAEGLESPPGKEAPAEAAGSEPVKDKDGTGDVNRNLTDGLSGAKAVVTPGQS